MRDTRAAAIILAAATWATAALAAAPPSRAPTPGLSASDVAELNSFFARLYATYRLGSVKSGVQALGLAGVYAPETAALHHAVETAQDKACKLNSDNCGVLTYNEGDPLIGGAQDNGDLRFTGFGSARAEPRPGLLRMTARYDEDWGGGRRVQHRTQRYVMERTPAGWRVFDVGGQRAAMRKDLADCRAALRRPPARR